MQQLQVYLDGNFQFVADYLAANLPQAVFQIPESTYLAWVDVSRYFPETEDLPLFFANKAGVLLEGGDGMFVGNAAGYVRLNLAMPRAIIAKGLERICEAINQR